jgi:hypothetical protein
MTLITPHFARGMVNYNIQSIYGNVSGASMSTNGRSTVGGGLVVSGNAGASFSYSPYTTYTAPVALWVQGNLYATSELLSDNNITSRSGYIYSRGSFIGSNPQTKANITKIDVDAESLLENVTVNAWNWLDEDGNPTERTAIGMLTSELPNIIAPPEDDSPDGNTYSQTAFDAVVGAGLKESFALLRAAEQRITELEEKIESLSA